VEEAFADEATTLGYLEWGLLGFNVRALYFYYGGANF